MSERTDVAATDNRRDGDDEHSADSRRRGRLRTWIEDPPLEAPPALAAHALVAHERFDIVRGTIFGIVLLPFWWLAFSVVIAAAGGPSEYEVRFTPQSLLVAAVIMLLIVPILHEAVHGLAALALGERPSFGLGLGFAYTTFTRPIGRRAYVAVALAPLIALSALGVALALVWPAGTTALLVFLATNAGGAAGDIWMAARAVRQPRHARFVDLADGFAVYHPLPAKDEP